MIFLIWSLFFVAQANAQPPLPGYSTPLVLNYTGGVQDYIVQEGVLGFTLQAKGGDGGNAETDEEYDLFGNNGNGAGTAPGGQGATLAASYEVGTGPGQIPPNSIIRFIVAGKGSKGDSKKKLSIVPQYNAEIGAGGGSSAILIKAPGVQDFIPLIIAGGGGGAHRRVLGGYWNEPAEVSSFPGQGASGSTCSISPGGWAGNCDGGGGESENIAVPGTTANISCGGGGFYEDGDGAHCGSDQTGGGRKAHYNGQQGGGSCEGALDFYPGGYGYSSGGAATREITAPGSGAGGGGGYTGGNGGKLNFNSGNGGGGGSIIFDYYNPNILQQLDGGTIPFPQNGKIHCITYFRPAAALCKTPPPVYLDPNGTAQVNIDMINNGSNAGSGIKKMELVAEEISCNTGSFAIATLVVEGNDGSVDACSVSIAVADSTRPKLQCPAPLVRSNDPDQCGAQVTFSSTASDNCQLTFLGSIPTSGSFFNVGTTTVKYTAKDVSGNSSTCTFTVKVNDTQKPNMKCKDTTVYLDNNGSANLQLGQVNDGSSDNCGFQWLTLSKSNFDCSNIGSNVITLTGHDPSLNFTFCYATISVLDKVAPSIICKPVIEAILNHEGTASITMAEVFQSGTDNCGSVNLESVSPGSFNCSNLGLNTTTLTANDGHGNIATCSTLLKVKELIAPTMHCKAATIYLDANGQATLSPAQVNNGCTDNCGFSSLSLSQTQFNCSNMGFNSVVLTGIDLGNNMSQCTANVLILDPLAPVAKCKPITANLGADGPVTINASSVNNGSSDNCFFTMELTPNTFNCSNVGANTVTLEVRDFAGSSAICSSIVTVKDLSAPTAICKNATLYVDDAGQATLNSSQINHGSSDACGILTMSVSKSQFNCSDIPGSSQTVTLTLKDVNNNTSTCNAQVTTKDNLAPTAVCENTTVQLGPNGMVTVYPEDLAMDSYDNCSVWSYSPVTKVYTTANLGNNNLTIAVKDWSGNAATCVSVVTVTPFAGSMKAGEARNEEETMVDAKFEMALFPNPTAGDATLVFQLPAGQIFQLRVFDMSGRLVLSQDGMGAKGENRFPIQMTGLAAGIYTVNFQSENLKGQERLVVE